MQEQKRALEEREQQLWARQEQLWNREMARWDAERRQWEQREAALLGHISQLYQATSGSSRMPLQQEGLPESKRKYLELIEELTDVNDGEQEQEDRAGGWCCRRLDRNDVF